MRSCALYIQLVSYFCTTLNEILSRQKTYAAQFKFQHRSPKAFFFYKILAPQMNNMKRTSNEIIIILLL